MKELLSIAGISKQGFWKWRKSEVGNDDQERLVLNQIRSLRKDHKRMPCRKIYHTMDEPPVGRDKFERIGFKYGYKLRRKRSFHKTTDGQEKQVFPNLVRGIKLTGINQCFQSDIFYYTISGKHYYGFTIQDIYSRRLLALHFAASMKAEELRKAFKQVINDRKGQSLNGCIFHSDRGSQYIEQMHKTILQQDHNMLLSMCKIPQENAYVERIQGILKQEYLDEYALTEENLKYYAARIKYLYNNERPHISLKMMSPIKFEQHVEKLSKEDKPILNVFKWDEDYPQKMWLLTKEKSSKKEN